MSKGQKPPTKSAPVVQGKQMAAPGGVVRKGASVGMKKGGKVGC